jgi:ASC-1-like (ASCH) protein
MSLKVSQVRNTFPMESSTMLYLFVAIIVLVVIGYGLYSYYGSHHPAGKVAAFEGSRQRELRIYAQEPWFKEIQSGRKIVEARVSGPEYYQKNIGNPAVVMVPGGESHKTHIIAVRHYPDLDAFLEKEDLKKYAPHLKTRGEAKAAYLATKDRAGTSIFGAERVAEKGGITAVELGAPKI